MYFTKMVVAVFAALLLPGAALAQHGASGHGAYGHGGGHGHGGDGHGGGYPHGGGPPPGAHLGHFAPGPVGHFGAHDMATWRGGYWWHGWRGGRVGWWWFAGGAWYWYPTPVYPFPDYVPDYWIGGGYPAPGTVWWFCDNPPGYYPYVQGCWRWRPVAPSMAPAYPPP